jgi:hypothetical protein
VGPAAQKRAHHPCQGKQRGTKRAVCVARGWADLASTPLYKRSLGSHGGANLPRSCAALLLGYLPLRRHGKVRVGFVREGFLPLPSGFTSSSLGQSLLSQPRFVSVRFDWARSLCRLSPLSSVLGVAGIEGRLARTYGISCGADFWRSSIDLRLLNLLYREMIFFP